MRGVCGGGDGVGVEQSCVVLRILLFLPGRRRRTTNVAATQLH
jgi:hypothetical protein